MLSDVLSKPNICLFFKLLPEFKNVKPWAGFYTPGLYLELFDTPALYFGIIPWAYTAFFIVAVNCRLQARGFQMG